MSKVFRISKELIEQMSVRAKGFLEERGKFYPFANKVGNDHKLTDVSTYEEENDMSAVYLLEYLQSSLKKRIEAKAIFGYGIAEDVELKEDQKAIKIVVNMQGFEYEPVYIPYHIKKGKVIFDDMLSEGEQDN